MTTASYQIKKLTLADQVDFAPCAKLFTAMTNQHAQEVPKVFIYPGPEKTVAQLQEIVQDQAKAIFIAKLGDNVLGAVQVNIETVKDKPRWRNRRFGYIERLFVDPANRRQGIAKALMHECEGWLRSKDIRVVELNTWAFNKEAQALFAKLGYDMKNVNLWRNL